MSTREEFNQLREELLDFIEETGIPKSRFGRLVMSDGGFIDRIERGRCLVTAKTILRCRMFMAGFRECRDNENL